MSHVTSILDATHDQEGMVNDTSGTQSAAGDARESDSGAQAPARAPGAIAGEAVGKLTTRVNMMTVRQWLDATRLDPFWMFGGRAAWPPSSPGRGQGQGRNGAGR